MFKLNQIFKIDKLNYKNESDASELDCDNTRNSKLALWNPKYFLLISMLFSFFPAAILYSINYKRLGYIEKNRKAIIIALVGMIVFIVLLNILPGTIGKSLATGINTAVGLTLMRSQAPIYGEHILAGGKAASFFKPMAICAVISAGIITLIIYESSIPETMLKFNEDEIYYTSNVSEYEVNRLGQFLNETKVFNADGLVSSVKLDREKNGTYILSFIVDKQNIENKELLEQMASFADYTSRDVFNSSKVQIDLCNDRFKRLKVVNP